MNKETRIWFHTRTSMLETNPKKKLSRTDKCIDCVKSFFGFKTETKEEEEAVFPSTGERNSGLSWSRQIGHFNLKTFYFLVYNIL